MKKAVFLDRDGTINFGIPRYDRVDSVDKVELMPGVIEALRKLSKLDYRVFFVTNQAGIAEGLITMDDFETINKRVLDLIAPSGLNIIKTYVCPHGEDATCECRKPKPKMLLDAAREYDIDLAKSWTVGDRPSDVMAGVNAGTKTVLVKSGEVSALSDHADFTADNLRAAIDYIANHKL